MQKFTSRKFKHKKNMRDILLDVNISNQTFFLETTKMSFKRQNGLFRILKIKKMTLKDRKTVRPKKTAYDRKIGTLLIKSPNVKH